MTRFQWSLDFQINEGAKHTMKKWIILLGLLSLALTITLFAEGKVVTTSSGLKYIDHQVGTGDEAVKGTTVNVHYTGWLYVDGKRGQKFDSSVDRGRPFSFKLGARQVISGWDEGVQGMKVGGKRELFIPPDLAYGPRGKGAVIPPGATLDFEVELLKVSK
jgi:peptidylprolyl isomerase